MINLIPDGVFFWKLVPYLVVKTVCIFNTGFLASWGCSGLVSMFSCSMIGRPCHLNYIVTTVAGTASTKNSNNGNSNSNNNNHHNHNHHHYSLRPWPPPQPPQTTKEHIQTRQFFCISRTTSWALRNCKKPITRRGALWFPPSVTNMGSINSHWFSYGRG